MRRFPFWLLFIVVSLSGFCGSAARAEDPEKSDRYMRVLFDEQDRPKAMETAIVRFVPTDATKVGVSIDLIGAVHIGDGSYYRELNKEFEGYDALLYELVAPKGTRPPKKGEGRGTGSLISQIQITMKQALALDFQLEEIDYEKPNFVHADMSPDQFARSMERLNEDPFTLFLRLMNASAKFQKESKRPPPSDLVILSAFFDRKRGPIVLKRLFAEQLAEADVLLEALNGPGGSTIITERNKVAIKVAGEQFDAGKKKLGVFYGAAHMQDMEQRLVKRFDMKRDSVRWLKAWDLTTTPVKETKPKSKPLPKPDSTEAIPETGPTDPKLSALDDLMREFLPANRIPGAALAVSHRGKIVYARGFGYADVEEKQPVQPESLFRVASISKPLTAIGIFRLIEAGKLRLEDSVFELLDLQSQVADESKLDSRWKQVTILQLLQHTAGWDRDKSFDPMFRSVAIARELGVSPPAKPADIIRSMLGRPLDFDPGTHYAYSNFGYCLLGRVIEKLTGKSYEDYMCQAVLEPAGAKRTRLGKTLANGRLHGEVRYYTAENATGRSVVGSDLNERVPLPYGAWCLEAMDSHGGWVSSTVDLLRVANALDTPDDGRLLNRDMLDAMFLRPPGTPGLEPDGQPKNPFYSAGWSVRKLSKGDGFAHEHTGSLDGTSTLLVHGEDGVSFAVLFNTRETPSKEVPSKLIYPKLREALDAVRE